MISWTGYDFNPWHAFVSEEFDDIALFNFLFSDTFCRMGELLPTSYSRHCIYKLILFMWINDGCGDYFHASCLVNT
jgi:hypothetical protein